MLKLFKALLFFIVLGFSSPVFAMSPVLPTGGGFIYGSGSINTSGSSMTIKQATSRGIINWSGFSIGPGGFVFFNNGSGATLNRVTGQGISSIAGMLKATGSLYLINTNGIIITPSGEVITGGDFVASTLNISDSDFLNGDLSFAGTTGVVNNEGSVNSSGSVVLVGTAVINSGNIYTPGGTASLISGTRLVMVPENGPRSILISPSSIQGNVTNTGAIKAASVYLSSSGGNVYALAGNTGGLIEATGTKTVNGQVWLTAPTGTVTVNSRIKAVNADGSGGNIFIDGLYTNTGPSAALSTSGFSGGNIKIGVSPYLQESLITNISSGTNISTGEGGLIETSGDVLNVGNLKVSAPEGEWVLDPGEVTIDSSAATSIDNALGTGDVTLTTTSSSANSNPSGLGTQSSSGNGDINVDTPILWSSSSILTLSAYNNININNSITVSGDGSLVFYNNNGDLNILKGNIDFTGVDTSGNPIGTLTIRGYNYTLVNANNLDSVGGTGNYALVSNITAPANFTIGDAFTGNFNGLGHTINITMSGNAGFFSYIGGRALGYSEAGRVENLGINVNITDEYYWGWIGGLVGINDGIISNCYVTGNITNITSGSQAEFWIGGLAGYNEGIIRNSYSNASVSIINSGKYAISGIAGGLVGDNFGGEIGNSYSTGNVSLRGNIYNFTPISPGGLVGTDYQGAIDNSYWDTTTSGQLTSAGGTGLTDAQMKQSSSFIGFDFKNVWVQDNGYTYPLLRVFYSPLVQKIIPILGQLKGKINSNDYSLFLTGNINGLNNSGSCANMGTCHAVLSPKQSGKLDKEIVKAGGKIDNKVLNNKFNKVVDDPYFGLILKNVLKKAIPNNGGGPT